jgi:hypothetical protein
MWMKEGFLRDVAVLWYPISKAATPAFEEQCKHNHVAIVTIQNVFQRPLC